MSWNQKIILGGVIIVFIVGIGWALQYVSQNDLDQGRSRMTNAGTDEGATSGNPRMGGERPQSASEQSAMPAVEQPVATATIESRAQAEQALLEIEGSFGEIEADISVSE
ncbi:MAG: hypothetical protein KBD27_00730 [Candidatus Moranbacteria bacterium]|nr:hypothetical protein [Candidatus Moranbacteria bacterium]